MLCPPTPLMFHHQELWPHLIRASDTEEGEDSAVCDYLESSADKGPKLTLMRMLWFRVGAKY